jgi:molybdopterin converting factor small subunit
VITVTIPALKRPLCDGRNVVSVEGTTLGEVFRAVDAACPGFYERVVEDGGVRADLSIAMNGEVLSLALHEHLDPGTELTLVPAIGGG